MRGHLCGAIKAAGEQSQCVKSGCGFLCALHVRIEPVCARIVRKSAHGFVSALSGEVDRPRTRSGYEHEDKRDHFRLAAVVHQSEHECEDAHREPDYGQMIEQHMDVLGGKEMRLHLGMLPLFRHRPARKRRTGRNDAAGYFLVPASLTIFAYFAGSLSKSFLQLLQQR